MSFGECLHIYGGAFVGGCDGKRIKRYMIDYKPGFELDCFTAGWSNIWKVEFNTVWQYRDSNMRKDTSNLTAVWNTDCIVPVFFPPYCLHSEPQARLDPSCWPSHTGLCELSGLVTLRLMVEDTDGNLYCDTQRLWIDNKPICAKVRIDAVPKCQDLFVSQFANPPECSAAWNLPLSGIAYDAYINDALPLTRPERQLRLLPDPRHQTGRAHDHHPYFHGANCTVFQGHQAHREVRSMQCARSARRRRLRYAGSVRSAGGGPRLQGQPALRGTGRLHDPAPGMLRLHLRPVGLRPYCALFGHQLGARLVAGEDLQRPEAHLT
jgi:hypothetical protein